MILTRCPQPECQTTFRVTPEQLKARGGKVRCGQCQHVFNALEHLLDGDIASNSHGWQWVAGTGTDAAPYFRIFNPVTQGLKFDPDGAYVRRHVPELAHLSGAAAHEPWKHPAGYAHGYPERIVDHVAARAEALARYEQARAAKVSP